MSYMRRLNGEPAGRPRKFSNMSYKIPITSVALAVALTTSALAQDEDAPAPKIDLSKFPAASIENVVVPVPSEIFAVLDKLGSPNWRAELSAQPIQPSTNRAQIALLLGTVIADGFVAVEAQDSARIQELGREVLRLGEAINVRKAVITRSKSITDQAARKNWDAVRREFDGALQDVRAAMEELNDEDLAQLVSLGGWIRGTEVLTSIVQKSYSPEAAELLHQPELLRYFSRRINDMSPRLRRSPLVSQINRAIGRIRPLIGKEDGSNISLDNVKRINTLTSELVQSIRTPQS